MSTQADPGEYRGQTPKGSRHMANRLGNTFPYQVSSQENQEELNWHVPFILPKFINQIIPSHLEKVNEGGRENPEVFRKNKQTKKKTQLLVIVRIREDRFTSRKNPFLSKFWIHCMKCFILLSYESFWKQILFSGEVHIVGKQKVIETHCLKLVPGSLRDLGQSCDWETKNWD